MTTHPRQKSSSDVCRNDTASWETHDARVD